MCKLRDKIRGKEYTGYKVVIEKKIGSGRYYSIAMGFEYKTNKLIPVVKRQRRIAPMFSSDILTGPAFEEKMEGRTAIFIDFQPARESINQWSRLYASTFVGRFALLQMTLKTDCMAGEYDKCDVVAGRMITSMKEIK